MSINQTKVGELKEMLAEISMRDVRNVADTMAAMERMAELGVSREAIEIWLVKEPYDPKTRNEEFHGFVNRKQAKLAAMGATRKSDRPGALGDAADRVNTLLKVQVPERASTTVGLSLVAIPAQQALPAAPETIKTFRRLPSGKMKAIEPGLGPDAIDVDAEPPAESTFTMKRAERR